MERRNYIMEDTPQYGIQDTTDDWLHRIRMYLNSHRARKRGDPVALFAQHQLQEYGWARVFAIAQKMCQSIDPESRCVGAEMLLEIDYAQALPIVLPLLTDADDGVRGHITGVLHDLGDARATMAVAAVLLHDPDGTNRHTAAYTLGKIGDARARPALEHARDYDEGADWEGRSVAGRAMLALEALQERFGS